jgi:hypothetical protein
MKHLPVGGKHTFSGNMNKKTVTVTKESTFIQYFMPKKNGIMPRKETRSTSH